MIPPLVHGMGRGSSQIESPLLFTTRDGKLERCDGSWNIANKQAVKFEGSGSKL